MKPNPLEPEDLTGADAIAWMEVQWRGGPRFGATLWTRSLMDDFRDAELMLNLHQARILFSMAGYDHGLVASNTVIRDMTGGTEPGEEYYGGIPLPRLPW